MKRPFNPFTKREGNKSKLKGKKKINNLLLFSHNIQGAPSVPLPFHKLENSGIITAVLTPFNFLQMVYTETTKPAPNRAHSLTTYSTWYLYPGTWRILKFFNFSSTPTCYKDTQQVLQRFRTNCPNLHINCMYCVCDQTPRLSCECV